MENDDVSTGTATSHPTNAVSGGDGTSPTDAAPGGEASAGTASSPTDEVPMGIEKATHDALRAKKLRSDSPP